MTDKQINEIKAMYKLAEKRMKFANTEHKRDIARAELIQLEQVMNIMGIEY